MHMPGDQGPLCLSELRSAAAAWAADLGCAHKRGDGKPALLQAILLIYYATPLSTVFEVVRSRNSASLSLPLCAMNVANGGLWLVYGIAIRDLFIAVPNGIGALLGCLLLALICAFPRKSAKRSPSSSEGTSSSQRDLIGAAVAEEHEAERQHEQQQAQQQALQQQLQQQPPHLNGVSTTAALHAAANGRRGVAGQTLGMVEP